MALSSLHRTLRQVPLTMATGRRLMSRTPNKEQQADVLRRMAGKDPDRYEPTDQEVCA